MRADRLLSILLLLQVSGRLTAAELADRLEVSPRTIYRDMEALSTAGVPVVAERGKGGGWYLLAGYRTDLTGFTNAEAQSVLLGQPAQLLDDLGLADAADSALLKLLAAMPALHRRAAEFMRQRIHIDTAGWRGSSESTPCLPTLQAALWQGCKLHLTYRRSDGPSVERIVDPLGLVAKGSVWYLAAGVEDEIRTYRVSRIEAAHPLDETAIRPPDFDLAAYWAESTAQFIASLPRYPTTLRAAPEAVRKMRYWRFAHIEQTEPPDADGWQRVQVRFEILEEACEYALGLGPLVEVIDPPALRQRVIEQAAAVVAFYAGDQSVSE